MSERPADDLPEMSDSMRDYVAAFAAVERPKAAMSAETWAAIEQETAPDRRRVLVLGIGAAVAVAAAVVLAFTSIDGSLLERDDGDPSVQAPHAGEVDETGGELSFKAPAKKAETPSKPRPAPLEANPQVEPDPAGVPMVPEPPGEAEPEPPVRPKVRKQTAKPDPKPSLQDELVLFKQAKRALDSGKANEAVSLLDRFAKEFPKGALRLEAQVLRAEALCAAGRTSAATKLRDRFVDRHPSNPLASRMRDVCK